MDVRKHLLETITLIAAAVICALISNGIASRERKVALVGVYPNAQKVPVEASGTPLPSIATPAATATATATVAMPMTTTTPAPMTMTIEPVATATTATAAPKQTKTTTAAATPAATPASAATTVKPASAADVFKRFPEHPNKAYAEIGYDDVAALHNAGALILDARRTSVYEQGHIAGARAFSVWESDVDDKVKKLFDERSDPAQQALPIVIYCSGGECEDSHMLAQKLWGVAFNNVYVYRDGFPDWQKRGGAVRTGANP